MYIISVIHVEILFFFVDEILTGKCQWCQFVIFKERRTGRKSYTLRELFMGKYWPGLHVLHRRLSNLRISHSHLNSCYFCRNECRGFDKKRKGTCLKIGGMRAMTLFTSLRSLRHCHRLTQVLPLCTFKECRNLPHTSWPLLNILKLRGPVKSDSYCLTASVKYVSSQAYPTKDDVQIRKKILSLNTVEKQLEFFESIKDSASIVNKVIILYSIAKITTRDEKQKQVLEQEKGKSRQASSSVYLALLDSVSKDISNCPSRELSTVFWALGKVQEKDHELVRVCERGILSRGITAFDNRQISQIVNGCVNLNFTSTEISSTLQESICIGQMKISNIGNWTLSSMLMLFAKTEGSNVELFHIFLQEILSRNIKLMDTTDLAQFVWSFAKKDVRADELFDRVEEEILRRGTKNFKRIEIFQIKWAFSMSNKGSELLFNILENKLVVRGLKFTHWELLDLVGSYARRNLTNSKVFNIVREEVFNRGVHVFEPHQLVHILFSFVSARRHDQHLVKEIESELLSRDVKQFDNGHLCQVAWSLGRARETGSKLFNVIEEDVLQRGLHRFSKMEKFMLLRGFTEAGRTSTQFYERLQSSLLTNDFADLGAMDIYDCARCFLEAGVKSGPLFDALEREILNKGKGIFSQKQLTSIKKIFQKVG